jgi:hypothetical protein
VSAGWVRAGWRRAGLAFSLAVLFFGRQIASWTVAENRYLYHWARADSGYLIAAVMVLALVVWGIGEGVRRVGGRRWAGLLFALGLGQVVVGLVLAPDAEKPREGAVTTGILLAVFTVWGFRRRAERVVGVATTAGLLALPLGPILFLQILSWRPYRTCESVTPRPAARAGGGGPPVFVLLFDEWSMARSERDGEFLPELVHLRRLAAMGTTYTDARSPGDGTIKAIPRILYGENGEVEAGNGEAVWRVGDSAAPATRPANLFRRARERGYRTELVGWYLPYAALIGDDLDACRTRSQVPKRGGPARLLDLTWANLRYLPDPVSRRLWRELYARWFSDNWVALERGIEREAVRLARESGPGTFAFVHFALPHAPFVFEADGSYRGPFEDARMGGSPDDYGRQVRYLDLVLGRFLDALEHAGRLDSAVVVVTSDHSWKKDPVKRELVRERLRRVPLVVKGVGARAPVRGGTVCLLELERLVGAAGPGRPSSCDVP